MNEALTEVEANGAVKVCVVTGTDDSFCGGMDLERCFLEPFDDPERFRSVNAVALQWFRQLKSLNAVTIAKVNGWCFGGGFELAGICDIVITRDDATFGLSEINFGIFPGGGTMWATAHNMPRKQALYYALTGAGAQQRAAAAGGEDRRGRGRRDGLIVAARSSRGCACLSRTSPRPWPRGTAPAQTNALRRDQPTRSPTPNRWWLRVPAAFAVR